MNKAVSKYLKLKIKNIGKKILKENSQMLESPFNTKFEEYISTILFNLSNLSSVGDMSDKYEVYITPDNKTFSIWRLIYRGLIQYVIKEPYVELDFNKSMVLNRDWIVSFTNKDFEDSLTIIEKLKDLNNSLSYKISDKHTKYYFDMYATWVTCATELNRAILIKYGSKGEDLNEDMSLEIIDNFIEYIMVEFSYLYGKKNTEIPEMTYQNEIVNIKEYLYLGQVETLRWAFNGILNGVIQKMNNELETDLSTAVPDAERDKIVHLESIIEKIRYLDLSISVYNTSTISVLNQKYENRLSDVFKNLVFLSITDTDILLFNRFLFSDPAGTGDHDEGGVNSKEDTEIDLNNIIDDDLLENLLLN